MYEQQHFINWNWNWNWNRDWDCAPHTRIQMKLKTMTWSWVHAKQIGLHREINDSHIVKIYMLKSKQATSTTWAIKCTSTTRQSHYSPTATNWFIRHRDPKRKFTRNACAVCVSLCKKREFCVCLHVTFDTQHTITDPIRQGGFWNYDMQEPSAFAY